LIKLNKKFFILIIIFFIIIIFLTHKIILKNSFESILGNLTEKKTTYNSIDFDFKNSKLKFYNFKIHNNKNFTYKNLIVCEEIIIKYDFKSFFSDTFIINELVLKKPEFYFEVNEKFESKEEKGKKIVQDNLSIVEKIETDHQPKIYPTKKKDKNFIINKVQLINPRANIRFLDIYEYSNFKLSNMLFSKVGNSKSNSQHYKEIFKLFLFDMYLRIPNFEIIKKLKKIYKL